MNQSLRIAMLAPLKRPITPDVTAARPRVMMDLISELVKKGHQVTVFGTGDSIVPQSKIVPIIPTGLNYLPAAENPFYQHTAYLTIMVTKLIERQNQFDLVHNHMYPEYLALLANQALTIPMVTTVHSQMTAETVSALKQFPQAHLVAISDSAKRTAGIDNMQVIHNGIDTDLFKPDNAVKKDYLLFVGRMSKAKDAQSHFIDPKGVQNAIAAASETGELLKIVGNVEDRQFFETLVKPHLSDKIEFVGDVSSEQMVSREQMVKLFQGAKAFIFPINWEEPFGLVMAEAMSCGTPVIAYNRGSVSEIVRDGVTGFIVEDDKINSKFQIPNSLSTTLKAGKFQIQKTGIDGLVKAVNKIGEIDRQACRKHVEENFSKRRMARTYEELYFKLIG